MRAVTNYYQNHRRYVKSVDTDQLRGSASSYNSISGGDCKPVDVRDGKPIYPCGLIANSVFNGACLLSSCAHGRPLCSSLTPFPSPLADTFTQPILLNAAGSSTNVTYNMTDKGIAWPGEHDKYKQSKYAPTDVVPPPYWAERYPNGYTDETGLPDLSTDEHFQVWMRTAGLPTFRKLYYRNDDEDMPAGTYEVDVFMSASLLSSSLDEFERHVLCRAEQQLISCSSRAQTTPSRRSAAPSRSCSRPCRSSAARTRSSASPTSPSAASASSSASSSRSGTSSSRGSSATRRCARAPPSQRGCFALGQATDSSFRPILRAQYLSWNRAPTH